MKRFFSIPSTRSAQARAVSSRRSGFTVIEVLVALVVLLIGGLAIMNLFPPALNVVRGSENREVAMAQVKGTLARYSTDPASIPDAIYDNSGGSWNDTGGLAVEGSRNRNGSLPNETIDYANSALGHFKHVVGERHKVLVDNAIPPNKFVLLNHAYQNAPEVRIEYSIEGARVSSNGALDFSDAVKSSDPSTKFVPVAGRYYASYSWLNGTYMQAVNNEPVDSASIPTMQVFQNSAVVSGPISMRFQQLVLSVAPIEANDPIRGRLSIDSSVNAGSEVTVDYDVLDWRWIIEDNGANVVNATDSTMRDVKLSVPELGTNSAGGTLPTGASPLYGLVMNAPNSSYNVVQAFPGKWDGTVGTDPVVNDVNRTSAVYKIDNSLAAPRVRSSYWTSQGWAQQLSVAASSYYGFDAVRTLAPNSVAEPWREYYWSGGSNTLYFHASEAGKTVMASYSSGANKFTNQILTISSKLYAAGAEGVPNAFVSASGSVSKATFINATGVPISADAITSVRGVSVQARSAWIQNGNYTQEVAEMYRPLN